jgi:hypothetical protein
MLQSYAMMMLNILFDALHIADTMLEPAIMFEELGMNLMFDDRFYQFGEAFYNVGREMEVASYRALGSAIVSRIRSFCIDMMFPIKVSFVGIKNIKINWKVSDIVKDPTNPDSYKPSIEFVKDLEYVEKLRKLATRGENFMTVLSDAASGKNVLESARKELTALIKDAMSYPK